jgi:hypothetical protein
MQLVALIEGPASAPPVSIDPARYRLTIELDEGSRFAMLPAILHRALEMEAYRPGMEILVDARSCRQAPSVATIRLLAEALAESQDVRGPVAILTSDTCTFGMGRMLEILMGMKGDLGVRVFNHHPDLESWLRTAGVAA